MRALHSEILPEVTAMSISPEDASASLDAIRDTAERTKKMVAYAGADTLFIVWGLIWLVGWTASHFQDEWTGSAPWIVAALWLVLVATGTTITIIVCRRPAVRSPVDKRIFWFCLFLLLYAGLWMGLLFPFIKVRGVEESTMFWTHLWAIVATVPLFAYVVMGLWLEHFMIWIGLAVTATTVAGLFLLQPVFGLWMAATGGGTLLATGLLIRNRWR